MTTIGFECGVGFKQKYERSTHLPGSIDRTDYVGTELEKLDEALFTE